MDNEYFVLHCVQMSEYAAKEAAKIRRVIDDQATRIAELASSMSLSRPEVEKLLSAAGDAGQLGFIPRRSTQDLRATSLRDSRGDVSQIAAERLAVELEQRAEHQILHSRHTELIRQVDDAERAPRAERQALVARIEAEFEHCGLIMEGWLRNLDPIDQRAFEPAERPADRPVPSAETPLPWGLLSTADWWDAGNGRETVAQDDPQPER